MRWWRGLWRSERAGDDAQDGVQAAALARLRGQCGLAAGECVPWDDQGEANCAVSQTGEERAGDERR